MTTIVKPTEVSPNGTSASPLSASASSLGLPSATALVIGSIIGTGVFTMPAVMAGAGTSSIITLAAIAVGALLLGVMFGQLTKRIPNHEGGLYAYARHEFGDFAGYLVAWCYWITCWAGNAAIVASWVLYVEELFGIDNPSAWTSFGIALTGLWVPAIINLVGVRQMAIFQNVTVVLKFLPLLAVATFGWFFIDTGNFGAFNASGRKPVRRGEPRRRRRPLLLHRGGVRSGRRRPGARPAPQRRPGVGDRHRRQRPAVRRRDGRRDGPRSPRRSSSRTALPSSPPSTPCSTAAGSASSSPSPR